ncbi:MAG: hypothetical protein KDC26_05355 [Armatimonadetes bacterium]|nr:hypothetical protein [Armatimonadota bacterium]
MAGVTGQKVPWFPLILLVVGIIFFWVYPQIRGNQPVKVEPYPNLPLEKKAEE